MLNDVIERFLQVFQILNKIKSLSSEISSINAVTKIKIVNEW